MSNIHLYLVNLYLMFKGVVGAAAVKGVHVCVYGPIAELGTGSYPQLVNLTIPSQHREGLYFLFYP